MDKKVALVLEGGGLRGNFTSGVLDYFLDNDIHIPYVIGVSMGACNGSTYVSKQRGRNYRVNTEFLRDKRYFSYRNLITNGELFGMDFIFGELPKNIDPFDMDTFMNSEKEFIAVATDCRTGEATYFKKNDPEDIYEVCKASSSLPLISNIVEINGKKYLDGAIADAIPVKKALEDGNDKIVLVLTRPISYIKKPLRFGKLIEYKYREYPNLVNSLLTGHMAYNETVEYIRQLEEDGKAFVIRPNEHLQVGRIERNRTKIDGIYKIGYEIAKESKDKLIEFINV
ncbi:patatin-like phospholipase family protein [Anaeromicrobium sediminis]|uniref:Patatin family protein n=1 Tax=Anaeromicrobium sediminis TaxID=1478221 RepID=A0A267MFB0_9FIRM|nr:patatin family protein [Anaeromicrobium sediminis]PAB58226.1 patatin family protein [Anaeromicrobium sediminis]